MSEAIIANNRTFTNPYLKIQGNGNVVCGAYCEVTGDSNIISGAYINVRGNSNILSGTFNKVVGNSNRLTGVGNRAEGEHNIVEGMNNVAVGMHTVYQEGTQAQGPTVYMNGNVVEGMDDIFSQFGDIFSAANMSNASSTSTTFHGDGNITIHTGGRRFNLTGNPRYNISGGNLTFTSWSENDRITEAGTTMTIDAWNQAQGTAQTNNAAVPTSNNTRNQGANPVTNTVNTNRSTRSANRRTFATSTNLDTTVYVKCPSAQDERHDKDAAPGGSTCVICHEKSPICIATPCMHMAYCVACSRSMCCDTQGRPKLRGKVACAKCRQQVHRVARVFAE